MLTRPVPKSARVGALSTIIILVVAAVLLPMARAEKSNKDAPATSQATGAGATEKAPAASESDTIVDPKTGLKFTVAKKISGENDVVVNTDMLRLSPNGKLLLYRGQVVPLDGGKPFKLDALHGTEDAAWSPDGRLIAYRDKVTLWLLPVSPETGQPTGPARKLLDEQLYWDECEILWSRDSQWIMLSSYQNYSSLRIDRCISVQDGRLMQPPDYTRFSLRSPDQKNVAYFKPHNGVWTAPVEGGVSRLAAGFDNDQGQQSANVPLWWSPDGAWLLYGRGMLGRNYDDLRFVRLADHREVVLQFLEQIGYHALGVSPDGKKLQFYKTSYEIRRATKVASIRGGRLAELAFSRLVGFNGASLSSPDGQRWFFGVYKAGPEGKPYAPYVAASATADSMEVKLPEEVKRERAINYWAADRWLLSPDGKRLCRRDQYMTAKGEWFSDLYVIPISLEKAESTGPATLIFKGWQSGVFNMAWSPDSGRLAIPGSAGLWVIPADGSPAKQLLQGRLYVVDKSLKWSPDGRFIAYREESPGQESLYTIPADGGTPKRLWTWTKSADEEHYAWFPDSREIGLVSDDALVAVDIADGSVRPFLKVAEAGLRWLYGLKWSPDGQTLALWGENDDGYQTALFYASDKKIKMLPPDPDWKYRLGWTGDSQAIFYGASRSEKIRPAGLIYEVDIGEAWTQAKNSVAGASSPASASPVAKSEAPPLVNGQFRDDFESGDTKYWTFQHFYGDYDRVCEVQNGELVLENTRALIGLPEWTNYVVTVKMCVKKDGVVSGIGFRRGEHGEYCLSAVPAQKGLWLGIRYRGADQRSRTGSLAEPPYDFVLDKWYTLQIEVKGPHIVVRVDGQPTIDLNDENCPQGPVVLIASLRTRVHFDDFSVRLLQ